MNRTWEIDEKRRLWSRGKCRWCIGPVAPPRKTFCGDACVHEWKMRTMPGYARHQVEKRDGGICAVCRRDCVALRRDLEMVAERSAREFVDRVNDLDPNLHRRVGHWSSWNSLALLESVGEGRRDRARCIRLDFVRDRAVRTLWDADHVVALEEGGECVIANLQTLCWLCHKAKTAEHARRRGKRKRAASAGT